MDLQLIYWKLLGLEVPLHQEHHVGQDAQSNQFFQALQAQTDSRLESIMQVPTLCYLLLE